MDETIVNEVVEEAPIEEEVDGLSVTEDEIDAMWEDDSDDEFADEAADETDQFSDGSQETEVETPIEDADQYLELKHFDEVRKVNKEEAKVLAQKGMDYDRIRAKLSEVQKYEDFLKEIQGDFASIEDLMDDTRARLASDRDGTTYEEALNKIKAGKQQAVSQEEILETMRQNSVQAFAEAHPDIKPDDIPKEVWDDIFVTNSLEASYAKWEAKKLAEENKVLKQNAKNKARSTGSMKSSGKSYADDIDRMWYEDDD